MKQTPLEISRAKTKLALEHPELYDLDSLLLLAKETLAIIPPDHPWFNTKEGKEIRNKYS
jgi:hypothetical protein